jgi:manganese/zinc/iron transport system substrate-binding protein
MAKITLGRDQVCLEEIMYRGVRTVGQNGSSVRLLLLAGLVLLLAACGAQASGDGADEEKVQVVATIGQVADLATNIGGDRVQVQALMGPGVDPHLYAASEGDVERLAEADLILYSGHFLEAQMAEVFEQIGERRPVVAVAEAVDAGKLLPYAAGSDEHDPHVWFDVALWRQAAEATRDALIAADPAGEATYRSNAESYLARLDALDGYVREQAQRVPPEQRVLVTAHDAFNYFGAAYGFEVRGLQGISTASEAGTADVRDLAAFIAERRIPAIFVESSVPVRNIEALQAAVAAQGWQVAIGGELFSDAMGSPGTAEGTYEGMVRHNIDTIVGALLGEDAGEEAP